MRMRSCGLAAAVFLLLSGSDASALTDEELYAIYGGSYCSPSVFDGDYYLNRYPDLRASGINTVASACVNWVNSGMGQGREAHPRFSPYEYVNLHGDLRYFGSDYRGATWHYVNNGVAEKRLGRITTPEVFEYGFYTAKYPELRTLSLFEAERHFFQTGMYGGRHAAPRFNVLDYLSIHSDLRAAFGTDTLAATKHYLLHGLSEGRLGSRDLTIANSKLKLRASWWVAGAIDSLVHNGREFVNNYDHGRQISVAYSYNNVGECDNPTENGTMRDGRGLTSSSVLLSSTQLSTNALSTTNRPAYWLRAGDSTQFCPAGTGVQNTTVLSNDTIQKTVSLGAFNNPSLIKFDIRVTTSKAAGAMNIEAPSVYLNQEFNRAYKLDLLSGQLVSIPFPSEVIEPVVYTTSDGNHAIGGFAEDQTGGYAHYVAFSFPVPGDSVNSTNKFSVVFNRLSTAAGSLPMTAYLAAGTQAEVIEALKTAYRSTVSPSLAALVRANFQSTFYRTKYPDLSSLSHEQLLLHYYIHGMREGRTANSGYDPQQYMLQNAAARAEYDGTKDYARVFRMWALERGVVPPAL